MEVFKFLENRELDMDNIFEKPEENPGGNIENSFRKMGHLMEKKINAWWDIATHEKYIKDRLIPRRLRWDVPINDGLTNKESTDEWFQFFNDKGLELLQLLIKRKQRKIRAIDRSMTEIKTNLEGSKDLPEFMALSKQLQWDMEQKDKETAARKKRKYQRDMKDYEDDLVYKWQNKIEEVGTTSNRSSPDQDTRLDDNSNKETNQNTNTMERNQGANTPNQKPRKNGNNNGWKPFWKKNWQNQNAYNAPRPFQHMPNRGRSRTPPWRNQTYQDTYHYENPRRDGNYYQQEERRVYENSYNVPVYNHYDHLRRDDGGGGTTPRHYENRTPNRHYSYGRENRNASPRRFLEQRRRESPRRHQENGVQRARNWSPETRPGNMRKEDHRNQNVQRNRDREEKTRRSPGRTQENQSGGHGNQREDAEREQRSRRKRD
ncbi:GATA zinc finger domain-containing protein 14-like [Rana temporaria]|uniref:GATA zinc finger domain-containing protein 14-like n=1 Tax=Rana temporaria TaxID=8407 RepID=UPI001AADDB33|nr:GATA zinc finger domain-containing protein 14-like [Rana temporaria]